MEIGVPMVFVVRVTQDERGATGGIVERLSTGEKARTAYRVDSEHPHP
jgi:hypothetical protein